MYNYYVPIKNKIKQKKKQKQSKAKYLFGTQFVLCSCCALILLGSLGHCMNYTQAMGP
jgi:hypothetical protein